MPRPALVLAAGFLALAACVHPPPPPKPVPMYEPPPLSYYEAGGGVPETTYEEVYHETDHLLIRKFRIKAHVPDELKKHTHALDDIEILMFSPKPRGGTPRPVVVLSPILGNSDLLVAEFSRGFVRIGYHAAIVKRKDFDVGPDTVIEDAEREFRVLVMRQKQAMDWLAARDEVDGSRMATFGVSAGSIISACVAGADTRPKANVLLLAGGPLCDVMMDTEEDRFQKYAEEMPGPRLPKEEIREKLRQVLRTDPLYLARRVRTENVFMILASKDKSVPIENGMLLWEALGRPRMEMIPFGHYNAFFMYVWMQTKVNDFLRERLGPP